ncbi:MAG: dihydrofolate reductase family protein [Dehalococcoidia bacterium]|nr:dihydrofolate reductase family protein [Dehalococcoidia bacterium]
MGNLIYTAMTSLDGYIEDEAGNFDWSVPTPEVHAFINDLERTAGTHLYGRRLYEVMRVWGTEDFSAEPPEMQDYAAIWQAAEKVVYSTTLESPSTPRTRIERTFDAEAVRALKASVDHDLAIGGAALATRALEAGLVDEVRLFIAPVLVGGGKPWLASALQARLHLLEEYPFPGGMVYLRYRTAA